MSLNRDRIMGEDGLLPKYHQVYMVLSQEIRDGRHSEATPMPGEVELSRQFGVSRITIRKALDRLEREGAISRFRGRGTFVRPMPEDALVAASLLGSIENLIAMGLRTQVRVISLDYVPVPREAASALGLASGAIVQRAIRVRSHNAVPFSYLTTYVPEDLGRTFGADDMAEMPLLLLLERAGVKIFGAEQRITAKLATPEVAGHLEIEPGEPLLSITRIVKDENDRKVEFIRGLYRPDTYEHRMSFDRSRTQDRQFWKT